MSDTNGNPPPVPTPATPPPAPVADPPVPPADPGTASAFTQKDLDDTAAAARNAATTQAQRKQAEDMGFASVEEMKTYLEAKRSEDQAAMTEAERLQAEAEQKIAQAEAATAAANERSTRADLRTALLDAQISPERAALAESLCFGDVSTGDGEVGDRIAARITQLQAETPEWFTPASGNDPENGQPPTGTPPPPATTTPPPPSRAGAAASGTPAAPSKMDQGTTKAQEWLEKRKGKKPADLPGIGTK